MIIPIGEWVLRTACYQAKAIHRQGFADFIMAVNISARQFQHPGFTRLVTQVLKETDLPPTRLELKITESLAMHDAEKSIATMNGLRDIGIQLSIDDFGTGYSSLSYLKRFPINKLKVDQSFVRNMTSNADDASIAKSVILLGQSLGLTVIAEGVETGEQLAMLGNTAVMKCRVTCSANRYPVKAWKNSCVNMHSLTRFFHQFLLF